MPTLTCPRCGGSGVLVKNAELTARRLERDLTLTETARRMGISIQYLSDLEKGRRNWDAELVDKFNKATR